MSDSKIRETVGNTSRLRNGEENHEWLPVSQAAIAKEWGVTAEQIKEWTTPTATTYFKDIEHSNGDVSSGFHGQDSRENNIKASTFAHMKLIEMMQESRTLEEYKIKLNEWADEHLALAENGGENNAIKILVEGRDALPEGLRIQNPVETSANGENKADFMSVSPKDSCKG